MQNELIDRVYEAGLVPELWGNIAADLAGHLEGRESSLILIAGESAEWIATPRCSDHIAAYKEFNGADPLFYDHLRTRRFDEMAHRGFTTERLLLSLDELACDPFQFSIRQNGLEFQAFSRINLPNDTILSISVERGGDARAFDRKELAFLDALYPHLVRASSGSTHLGMEKARASVASMEGMGFPAAMLDRRGVAVATNVLFEGPQTPARTGAFGRVHLLDAAADLRLAHALDAMRNGHRPTQQSIAVRAGDSRAAAIVHLLPIRQRARDVFSGGEMLLVISPIDVGAQVPSLHMLTTLFDLSPAEARLAARLAAGASLQQAAVACGITLSSARTYLIRIFRKTGTNQQSQLVALLKTAQTFPSVS